MITVVIAFVAALIAMLLTIWDCDFKWVKYSCYKYYRNDNCSYNQGHDVSIRVWLDGEIGRRPRCSQILT